MHRGLGSSEVSINLLPEGGSRKKKVNRKNSTRGQPTKKEGDSNTKNKKSALVQTSNNGTRTKNINIIVGVQRGNEIPMRKRLTKQKENP